MKSKTKRILTMILCFALAFVLGGEALLSAFSVTATAAEQSFYLNATDPLDDLKGGMVNGVAFNTENFNFDKNKETTFLTLLECGYSYDGSKDSEYELYFYIYNPRGIEFDMYKLHHITLRAGSNTSLNYTRYDCSVVKKCEYDDFYGLFYKLKVILSASQIAELRSKSTDLNSSNRLYTVGEVELYKTDGSVEPIGVGDDYYFSGYMAGYGPNPTASSTLSLSVDDSVLIQPDVKFAYYRPKGTQEGQKYIQDSLHSCYFGIEKEIVDEYGEPVEMHADFYNAVLNPGLITGNKDAYNAILPYVGVPMLSVNKSLRYGYVSNFGLTEEGGGNYSKLVFTADYKYNYDLDLYSPNKYEGRQEKIEALYLVFPTDFSMDSADSWVVSGQEIQEQMLALSKRLTGDTKLYNNGYSSLLFESYDTEKKEIRVTPDELDKPLISETVTQNWWQKIWGTETVHTETFDGIEGIHKVTAEDFSNSSKTDEEKAQALYVSEGDYAKLKDYFEKVKNTHYVYLFRYQVSDYIAEEATCLDHTKDGTGIVDTNAYFFQMSCNLDFDVIDCTFEKNGVRTVIPVVMSPQDFIPDATPPIYTESDAWRKGFALLVKLILALIVVVGVCAAFTFITPLKILLDMCIKGVKLLLRFVTWPLRFLFGMLFGRKK